MAEQQQRELSTLLDEISIKSTEELTRTLRAASRPAQQRLALAWAILDDNRRGAGKHEGMLRRLSTALVRREEVLAEWIFSAMLRELKGGSSKGSGSYQLHRDPDGIQFLSKAVECMDREAAKTGRTADLHTVLQGPVLAVLGSVFRNGVQIDNAQLVENMCGLWRAIEAVANGREMVTAQREQLAQVVEAATEAACVNMEYDNVERLQTALRDMVRLASNAMRRACEATLNARKAYEMAVERLLGPGLRLCGAESKNAESEAVLDMLQAGLFQAENTGRIAASLNAEGEIKDEQGYAKILFEKLAKLLAIEDAEQRAHYAAALPRVLERFLQSAALVSGERRGAATEVGQTAAVAHPQDMVRSQASTAGLGMYSFMFGLLQPLCGNECILAAGCELARVYFGDASFGVEADVQQQWTERLEAWLGVVGRVLDDSAATGRAQCLALQAVDVALKAAPDTVLAHSARVLDALVRVEHSAAVAATACAQRLVQTLGRARQIDMLVTGIAQVQAGQTGRLNVLAGRAFLDELRRAIAQAMPFSQASASVAALVDAVCGRKGSGGERKRQRVSSNTATGQLAAVVLANVLLASVETAATERQRVQLASQLEEAYERAVNGLPDDAQWERLLLHHAFVESAARVGGTGRWRDALLQPERMDALVSAELEDPRASTLGLLVALQTAAHWAAEADGSAAKASARVVAQMLARVFRTLDTVANANSGWDAWDGQAASISVANVCTAQWRVVVAWLDVACTCADTELVEKIARRIMTGIAAGDRDTHALLESGDLYELGVLRDAFVGVLMSFAQSTWQAQTTPHPPRLAKRVDAVLAQLADSDSCDAAVTLLDAPPITCQRRRLNATQAQTWQRLMRALLRFPTAYWTAAHAHALMALALTADVGIALACAEADDARTLRGLSTALLERLVRHAPGAAARLARHTPRLTEHWIEGAKKPGALGDSVRALMRAALSAHAQSAFAQESRSVHAECRKLCVQLLDWLNPTAPTAEHTSVDVLGAVSCAVQQHVDRKLCGRRKWAALLESWLMRTDNGAKRYLDGSTRGGDAALLAAACIGAHAALRRIYFAATGKQAPASAGIADHGAALLRTGLPPIPCMATWSLLFDAIARHSSEVGAGLLGSVVQRLAEIDAELPSDTGVGLLRAVAAAVAGRSCDDSGCDDGLTGCILRGAVDPLLLTLDGDAFTAALREVLLSANATAVSSTIVLAFVRAAYRHGGPQAATRQRAVQKHAATVLVSLHEGIRTQPSRAQQILATVSEIGATPALRLTMFDASEAVAAVATAAALPAGKLSLKTDDAHAELFEQMCHTLGSIVRHHGGVVLDGVALITGLMRTLLHAFVTPPTRIDVDATPWIIALAPLPSRCAAAYARVLADLCHARRPPSAAASRRFKDPQDTAGYVRATRGTDAADAAAVLAAYMPHVLAEYCVVQGSVAATGATPNGGLTRRLAAVPCASEPYVLQPATIATPALREALLPGWHAVLDTIGSDGRATLLTQLALQSGSSVNHSQSGAHEVLKSLYQSYVGFYQYSGNV
ncbi:hypothetical protein H4R24_000024 [Coemansia sp. RSA 988]|nr:hypothetical protein H4R24_000024 [Coemansia sp. RSA 988]